MSVILLEPPRVKKQATKKQQQRNKQEYGATSITEYYLLLTWFISFIYEYRP